METGWLVESAIHGIEGVYYLRIRKLGNWELDWLPGADKALRFARQQDAEAMIEFAREVAPELFPRSVPMPRATEHMWDSQCSVSVPGTSSGGDTCT